MRHPNYAANPGASKPRLFEDSLCCRLGGGLKTAFFCASFKSRIASLITSFSFMYCMRTKLRNDCNFEPTCENATPSCR
jgi:hypothetical protein